MAAKEAKAEFSITAIDNATRTIRNINRNVTRMVAPAKAANDAVHRLGVQMGFRKLGRSVQGVTRNVTALTGRMRGFLNMLPLLGGAGIAGAAFGLNKIAEAGDKIAKTSRMVGLGVEEFQEWGYVAERNGVSQELMNGSLLAFSKRMGEMRAKTGGLYTLLKKVNPALIDQVQAAKSNGEAFGLMMQAISKLENPQQRAALAAAAFSRSGVALVNIAAAGTAEIAKQRQEIHDLGGVMSEKAATDAEKYVDAMTNVSKIVQGVGYRLVQDLIPAVQDIATQFTDWYKANRELVKVKVAEYAKALTEGVKGFVAWIKEVGPKVGGFIDTLGGLSGILKILAGLFAVNLVGSLAGGVLAIGGLVKAFWGLGAAMMATPVGWIVMGVAALAGAVYLVYRNWDKLKAWWDGVWNAIGGTVYFMVENITGFFSDIYDGAMGWIDRLVNAVTGRFHSMWKGVADMVPEWVKDAGGAVSSGLGRVKSWFSDDDESRGATSALRHRLSAVSQETRVGGLVRIQIDDSGRARVREVRSDNQAVGLDVDAGLFAMP